MNYRAIAEPAVVEWPLTSCMFKRCSKDYTDFDIHVLHKFDIHYTFITFPRGPLPGKTLSTIVCDALNCLHNKYRPRVSPFYNYIRLLQLFYAARSLIGFYPRPCNFRHFWYSLQILKLTQWRCSFSPWQSGVKEIRNRSLLALGLARICDCKFWTSTCSLATGALRLLSRGFLSLNCVEACSVEVLSNLGCFRLAIWTTLWRSHFRIFLLRSTPCRLSQYPTAAGKTCNGVPNGLVTLPRPFWQ